MGSTAGGDGGIADATQAAGQENDIAVVTLKRAGAEETYCPRSAGCAPRTVGFDTLQGIGTMGSKVVRSSN